jgi:nucleotide-binding universal stress UspA family protein
VVRLVPLARLRAGGEPAVGPRPSWESLSAVARTANAQGDQGLGGPFVGKTEGDNESGGIMSVIVVGVDGSEYGEAALRFAAEEAALRGARLRIVCAWQVPASVVMSVGLIPDLLQSFGEEAETIVQAAVAGVGQLQPSVSCDPRVVEGHAGSVLLDEARGAALLVVGSRGRGEFAGMLLGSVSQQVVHHAPCPVTVVPKDPV